MAISITIAAFLSINPSVANALALNFWFDHKPPGANEKTFFEKVSTTIVSLNSKIEEQRRELKSKSIHATKGAAIGNSVKMAIASNGIDGKFFYDFEYAQLVLAGTIFSNECKLRPFTTDCRVGDDAIIDKLVLWAYSKTNKARDVSHKNAVDSRNRILLTATAAAIVGGSIYGLVEGASSGERVSVSPGNTNASHCSSSDFCHELVRHEKNKAIVRCTKGPSAGREKCLSYNGRKYDSSCGIGVTSLSHNFTLEKAANTACQY